MKVIVAGSREIENYNILLDAIKMSEYDIREIISGCARGVDMLGERYARENNIPLVKFPANWNEFGKKAGPMRNSAMAHYCDSDIIIWNGKSSGTDNMIWNMKRLNKPYYLHCI